MLRFIFSCLIVFQALISLVVGETGCPPEEDIAPCVCIKHPVPRLTCKNIMNPEVLLNIFRKSERHTFQEVHIISSALIYIPTEIFLKTYIKELYLTDCSIGQLFDDSLELVNSRNGNKHPFKMQIENVKLMRGLLAYNFTSFTNLKELTVKSSSVRYLTASFSSILPNGLKQLSFSRNNVKRVRPGALRLLPNLDKFSFEHNDMKNISRDIFPRPFNVRFLYFDFNRIDSIPNDMFHDMPKLQFLSMKNNLIRTIPESAFQGRFRNVPFFRFDGNPLNCDCEILWIIKDKPEILGGNCTSPAILSGRKLEDLNVSDFAC